MGVTKYIYIIFNITIGWDVCMCIRPFILMLANVCQGYMYILATRGEILGKNGGKGK